MWSLFLEAFSRGHFATLAGRTTRREFWSFAFFYLLISFVLNALSFYAATSLQGTLFAMIAWFWILLRPSQAYFTH